MAYDPEKHHRRSIRLNGYDYSQAGAYFVTLCLHNREPLFGQVVCGAMQLNPAGHMIEKWWAELPHKFASIDVDEYVVMPDHYHGIIVVTEVGHPQTVIGHPHRDAPTDAPNGNVGTDAPTDASTGDPPTDAPTGDPPTKKAPTLGDIVDWFKTMTTNEYIRGVKGFGWQRFAGKLWQGNYYEHIVRSEYALGRIRKYIRDNPARWREHEDNLGRIEVYSS